VLLRALWIDPDTVVEVRDRAVTLIGQLGRRSLRITVDLVHGLDGVVDVVARPTFEVDDTRSWSPPTWYGPAVGASGSVHQLVGRLAPAGFAWRSIWPTLNASELHTGPDLIADTGPRHRPRTGSKVPHEQDNRTLPNRRAEGDAGSSNEAAARQRST
jgi:hypothetical protein